MNLSKFCGHFPNLPVAVDAFSPPPAAHPHKTQYFFLSHFHADHYDSLTSSRGVGGATLFASHVTCSLLREKFPGIECEELEVGVPKILSCCDGNGNTFTVTPLHANHCPGSLMFVFEHEDGVILHTGDFRASHEMAEALLARWPTINTVYLDTTFCEPEAEFPVLTDCARSIVGLVSRSGAAVVDIRCLMLGHEQLAVQVANLMNQQVCMPKHLVTHLRVDPTHTGFDSRAIDLGEEERQRCRVHACCNDACVAAAVQFHRGPQSKDIAGSHHMLRIRPHALFLTRSHDSTLTIKQRLKKQHVVRNSATTDWDALLSLHSSHSELITFLKTVQPKLVVPTTQVNAVHFNEMLKSCGISGSQAWPEPCDMPEASEPKALSCPDGEKTVTHSPTQKRALSENALLDCEDSSRKKRQRSHNTVGTKLQRRLSTSEVLRSLVGLE